MILEKKNNRCRGDEGTLLTYIKTNYKVIVVHIMGLAHLYTCTHTHTQKKQCSRMENIK